MNDRAKRGRMMEFEVEYIIAEPRTPEWFATRKGNVTNSRLGLVCDIDPTGTPADLWAEMEGLVDPPEETPLMTFGRWGYTGWPATQNWSHTRKSGWTW